MDNMVLEAAQLIYPSTTDPAGLLSLNYTFPSQSDPDPIGRLKWPAYQEPVAVMPDAGICQRKSGVVHHGTCTHRRARSGL